MISSAQVDVGECLADLAAAQGEGRSWAQIKDIRGSRMTATAEELNGVRAKMMGVACQSAAELRMGDKIKWLNESRDVIQDSTDAVAEAKGFVEKGGHLKLQRVPVKHLRKSSPWENDQCV